MQGVAFHRERARQEQMALEAQQRAQQFRLEEENRRNQFQLMRDRAGRDFETLTYNRQQADKAAATAGERAYRESQDAAKRAQEGQDAGALQSVLEGQGLLPMQQAMPEGEAGPGARLPRLSRPEDVRTAATLYGQDQARQAAEANRVRDDERASQSLELNRQRVEAYVQSIKGKGTPPSEEDIHGLADAIQASNPGIPASQAMGIARARIQYKAPMQIPTETLAQKGEAKILDGQIGSLRSIRQSLLGANGRSIAKKLGADMGIPEIPSETVKGQMNPDMVKIFDALDGQIGDLEAKRRTMGMAPAGAASTLPQMVDEDPADAELRRRGLLLR